MNVRTPCPIELPRIDSGRGRRCGVRFAHCPKCRPVHCRLGRHHGGGHVSGEEKP